MNKNKFIKQALKDLKIYGGCAVCIHCDIDKYPMTNYCEFGGCN
jgi:aminoglycoside N3'-acetyltransferase